MTPTYAIKGNPILLPSRFLAPHFLCKIDSAFIDSVFFWGGERGENHVSYIFWISNDKKKEKRKKEKKECIFPQIALQHCWFATKFFSPSHLIAKED